MFGPFGGNIERCICNEPFELLAMQGFVALRDLQSDVISKFTRADAELTRPRVRADEVWADPVQRRSHPDLEPVPAPFGILQEPGHGASRASPLQCGPVRSFDAAQ